MTKHKTLPIQFDGWDEAGDLGDIQFYEVEFLENFGPFSRGEKIQCLARMDADGVLAEYINGVEGRTTRIKYVVA